MKRLRYEPIEVVLPQENPGYGDRPRFRRSPHAAEPGAEYSGLRVRVALVRDPGYKPARAPQIHTAADVANLVRKETGDSPVELFLVLLLTGQHRCSGVHEVHRGTLTNVEVHPADVLRVALAAAAPAIILVHNHPSGDPLPSAEDRALTRRMKEAAKLLGIVVLDHVIVTHDSFASFADTGIL